MAKPIFDCLTCAAFRPHLADNYARGGTCRKHPPIPVMVGVQPDPRHANQMVPDIRGCYPSVGKGDWCLDHVFAAQYAAQARGEAVVLPGSISSTGGSGEAQ